MADNLLARALALFSSPPQQSQNKLPLYGALSDTGGGAPTIANQLARALLNVPTAISEAFKGNAYGTAEPTNPISDMARQQNWRGSVFGVPQDVQDRNYQRALAVALAAPTVYHGSPHKFDAFDSSKIGAGEGAQAYGHGLYFAENPKVAQDYAVNLAAKNGDVGGRIGNTAIADAYKAMESQANRLPPAQAGPLYNRLDLLERLGFNELPDDVLKYAKETYGAASPEVSWLQTSVLNKYKGPGNLYTVDLPDSAAAKMLDWDKPLSQQHPDVKDLLRKADIMDESVWQHYTGKQLYEGEMNARGPYKPDGWADSRASVGVSELLRQAGIPGIRYLDQGSRGAGQGTSNYVVFPGNESLLKILKRE